MTGYEVHVLTAIDYTEHSHGVLLKMQDIIFHLLRSRGAVGL